MLTTEACRKVAKRYSELQRERYRTTANRNARERSFVVGQKVYMYIPKLRRGFSKTMSQLWHDPYTVTRVVSDMKYGVKLDETGRELPMAIHVHRLKAAVVRIDWEPPSHGETIDDLLVDQLVEEDLPFDSFEHDKRIGVANVNDREDETQRLYEIEKIIQAKHFPDGLRYLCKWRGYGKEHNSYEPFANLNDEARRFIKNNNIKTIGRPSELKKH